VDIDSRWMWRVGACVGVAFCVGLALMNVAAYLHHRDTGDHAGFALGMTILEYWLMPATSIALVMATAWGGPKAPAAPGPFLARAVVALLFAAGAAFFLGFAWFVRHLEGRGWPAGQDVMPGAQAYAWVELATEGGFGLLLAASAAAVLKPAAARSPWFLAVLAGVGIVGVAGIVALLASAPGAVIGGAPPDVALVLVVTWTLHSIRRSPAAVPSG